MRDLARFAAAVGLALAVTAGPAWPADPPAKDQPRVKATTQVLHGDTIMGVVGKISKDEMTVVEFLRDGAMKEHRLLPIDILRDGDYINFTARYAYRWGDVKAGDTVQVIICNDPVDKEWYCQSVSIERRPKAKLPKSQRAEDDWSFAELTLLNDIDNGEDVSDENIAKVFPSRPEKRDPSGRLIRKAVVGGLKPEYQAKLDAIREKAKKEQNLKAAPPDKK